MALTVKVSLLRCGKCGKAVNPFGTHVCNGRRAGRTSLKPALSVTSPCPSCGKQRSNPFTHTCTVRTDFKARQRQAERQVAAASKRGKAKEARDRKHARETARRKAAAERRRQAAARKRAQAAERRRVAAEKRKAASAAKRKPAARPARPTHDYRTCTDGTCHRYACVAWKEAWQEGRTSGLDDGYDIGFEAGIKACPLEHI
jgi:hypothetical protein